MASVMVTLFPEGATNEDIRQTNQKFSEYSSWTKLADAYHDAFDNLLRMVITDFPEEYSSKEMIGYKNSFSAGGDINVYRRQGEMDEGRY